VRPPTTAAAPTTTARPLPSTTTEPPEPVTVEGDLPGGLLAAVGEFYSWLADRRNPRPNLPSPLVRALWDLELDESGSRQAAGVVRRLENGDSVAVVHVGEDDLFMVKDAEPWRVAGVTLDGIEPYLGRTPRLLLVLGSDARPGENQQRLRADSIHIVGIAPERSEGSIVGFPRDSWVRGPEGNSKFTNIMAGRGPDVMVNTMEDLTGLDIDGYIVTGFSGFEGLIRDVGGLLIDLPRSIKSGIEGWQNYPSGVQKLGPTAVLRLARIRKTLNGGDFARSANHGLIMLAGLIMVQEMGVDALPELLDILLDRAWTDLSTENLLTLAATVYILEPEAMVNMVMPGSVGNAGSQSVVFLADSAPDVYADLADGVIDESG